MNQTPRVAAVHDLSGFGRCSLTTALPVLAVFGCQCCPLPTAVLSAHTGFPASDRAVFHDLTDLMAPTLDHWEELGLTFDAVYSGFLGSARQIDVLEDLLDRFRAPGALVLVDPVMGDHGTLYRTYTPELCARMVRLAERADLITPNLTEAAQLLGEPYDPSPAPEKTAEWLERLSLDGRRSVVLTGISSAPGLTGAAGLDRAGGGVFTREAPLVEGTFPGTGDLFASVLLGSLLRGADLAGATEAAVRFTQKAALRAHRKGLPPLLGPDFEPLLKDLIQ